MTPSCRTHPRAADLRRRARRILDRHDSRGGSPRLTMILCQILIVTFAVALYLAALGICMAVSLLLDPVASVAIPGSSAPVSAQMLVDVGAYVLLILPFVMLILPLCASLYRIAVLAVAADGTPVSGSADDVEYPTLMDLFYPFTSLRAYGRTMIVVLDCLVWLFLILGLPSLLLAFLDPSLLTSLGMLPSVAAIIGVIRFLPAVGLAVLFFLLSGSRAGFGAFLFRYADLPIGEVRRFHRARRRPLLPVLGLRFGFFGWALVSFAGAFLPAILHVIPYAMLTTAAWADELARD